MHPIVETDFHKIASLVGKGHLFPAWRGKAEEALLVIYVGHSLGLNWVYSLTNITVINGRPVVWGDAMMALCQRSTCMEYCQETFDETTLTAICEVKRVGRPAQVRRFSKVDAERAGLWNKGPWRSYPQRMLQMRARGFALRDMFADILQGVGLAEEVRDYALNSLEQKSEGQKEQSSEASQLLKKGHFANLEVRDQTKEPSSLEPDTEVVDTVSDSPVSNVKRAKVLKRFEELGVSEDMILLYLKKTSIDEIDDNNVEHLINIGKDISDKICSINQIFNSENTSSIV